MMGNLGATPRVATMLSSRLDAHRDAAAAPARLIYETMPWTREAQAIRSATTTAIVSTVRARLL